jgi:hypothetical protein
VLDNFIFLAVEGVLSLLNSEGCRELGRLHELAISSDTVVLDNVPKDVQKLVGHIMRKWWKPHDLPEALHRLEVANATTISHTDD